METVVILKIVNQTVEDSFNIYSIRCSRTIYYKYYNDLTIIAGDSQFKFIGPFTNFTLDRTEIERLEAWIE